MGGYERHIQTVLYLFDRTLVGSDFATRRWSDLRARLFRLATERLSQVRIVA